MKLPSFRHLLLTCSVLLVMTAAAAADNWPQWRGANHDGICTETNLPTEWSPTKNVAWQFKLPGMGGSTPAIWEDRIFLTCEDGDDLVVLCLGTDGKERWKQKVGTGKRRFRQDEGNQASASPSTDGKHVYAFFGTGDFACFDVDGKSVWNFNAQERYGQFKIMHGMHVTPLLDGDRLYVSLLHQNGQWVVALDKKTGKEVWKVARPTDGEFEGEHSYASPTLWQRGGDRYLVVHGCDYTTAHRLNDGSEIWRLGDLNSRTKYDRTFRLVASPAVSPDLIVVPTAKNGPVVALKPDAKGKIGNGSEFEQWRKARGTTDVPSPVIKDGLVYMGRENGLMVCLDAKTGKELYQERLHNDRYRGSTLFADGKIYLTSRGGVFSVLKAGPEFKVLAVNRLPDVFTASPAVSRGRIYLRGYETLWAIEEKK